MPDALWETEYTAKFHHAPYGAISPSRPELSAAGKTILISGGGRGLGVALTTSFAQAGAAHIVITGRDQTTLQDVASKLGAEYPATKISAVAGDVSKREDVVRVFQAVGKVDVVVANAGYLATVAPIPPASSSSGAEDDAEADADWWRAYEVNVLGTYLFARRFLASANPGAVFISINAAAAILNPPVLGFSAYASSKIGAARVLETMQREEDLRTDKKGLRFYSVHPGAVESDMLVKSGLKALGDALPLDKGKSRTLISTHL